MTHHALTEPAPGPRTRHRIRTVVFSAAIALATASPAPGLSYHVATNGNDANLGTNEAAPFATLERARDAIRDLKRTGGLPAGGVTVWIRGGAYARTNTFELTGPDSGAPGYPVVYRARTGETVRIHGALPLPSAQFAPVTPMSPVWSRLDSSARPHIVQLDLRSLGITNYGILRKRGFGSSHALAAMELFFDGEALPPARWPDEGECSGAATQSFRQATVNVHGSPQPDVTGTYVADGLRDGVNAFRRQGLVAGRQYHLYRHRWPYGGVTNVAWFLAAQTNGYPSSIAPWWSAYSPELNDMRPANRGVGGLTFRDPGLIKNGFAYVAASTASNQFGYAGDRPRRWTQAEEPWFHGFWMHLWADFHLPASAIDTTARTVTFPANVPYGIAVPAPYYAENLLEEITRPGEWHLQRHTGVLYTWPPCNPAGREIFVSMMEPPLVHAIDTTNTIFRNLTFEMARGELVRVTRGTHNRILDCVLRNAGAYAAVIAGGTRNGIAGCEVTGSGDGAIQLSGGNRVELAGCGNYAHGNTIRRFGRWSWMYTPGVRSLAGGVGHRISNNLLYDAPHTAILVEPGNHATVELNEVHDVCKWSSDAGAVYAGRDLGARGTILRHNFIHNISSPLGPDGCGVQGIYLDDCISGIEVYGNILYRIMHLGIQHGGGRDVRMENNILVRCGSGLGADARGIGWMMRRGSSHGVWRSLQSLPYRSALWTEAFPECAAIPDDWGVVSNGNWMAPGGSVFARNLGFANTTFTSSGDRAFIHYRQIADNVPDADPLFADEARMDFTLSPKSPAFAIPGFRDIPFREIGPPKPGKPRELACWDFAVSNDVEGFAICDEVIPSPVLVRGMTAEAAPGHPTWALRFRSAEIEGATETEAVAAGDFIEVTLAPPDGRAMSLVRLAFEHRSSSDAADTILVRSSVDGFAATLGRFKSIGSSRWSPAGVVFPSDRFQDLTGAVTFRFYLHRAAGTAAPGSIAIDSIAIHGTTQPVPPRDVLRRIGNWLQR